MPGGFWLWHSRMAHSGASPVSLGRHFAPIAHCALLCIVKVPASHLAGMSVFAEGTMEWGFARVHVHLPVRSIYQFEEFTLTPVFPLFLLDWAFPMGELASSSELIRCFWPWTWLALGGEHLMELYVQARCCVTSWHCSWWPQPEHCRNICWDICVWTKECYLAPNYFPEDHFLYGYCS